MSNSTSIDKNKPGHLPSQIDINIWDAAHLLCEWLGNVQIWDGCFKGDKVIQLHEGFKGQGKPYFRLSLNAPVEYKRSVPSPRLNRDLRLFHWLYRITGDSSKPDPITRSQCTELNGSHWATVMFDGTVFLRSEADGILIVGNWERYKNTLWLCHTQRETIKTGFVEIPYSHDAEKKVCRAMNLFHSDPTSGELDLI